MVVQDAQDMTVVAGSIVSWLTPITNMGVSGDLAGAEMTTFLAPPLMCSSACSWLVNTPEDSIT